jgi:SSS family solute:Na+ symporter
VIFFGLFAAGVVVVKLLPEQIGLVKAIGIAGKMGRTNAVDFKFDWNNPYTLWSGLIGGFFLQLSYFGTDQSQVGRYLTGASVTESRLGLLMNGLVKIPMQFLILLIGVLVFTFYQYTKPPVFFNRFELDKLERSPYKAELNNIKESYNSIYLQKQALLTKLNDAVDRNDEHAVEAQRAGLVSTDLRMSEVRKQTTDLMVKNDPKADINDNNYIFLSFVTNYLPKGLIGLLIAIIFLASMGSTASALNSLASTSVVDVYKRLITKDGSEKHYLAASRWATVIWGIICILMALYASKIGNLIEAVNILGSYVYGTILGVFLVAFYAKQVNGTSIFLAAMITEAIVCLVGFQHLVAYLWLNVIGCLLVVVIAVVIQVCRSRTTHIKS